MLIDAPTNLDRSWLRTAVQATPLVRPLYLRQLTFDFELPLFDLSFRLILQLRTILRVL
jgi:hypothetical protein